jgi:hypothetical protein
VISRRLTSGHCSLYEVHFAGDSSVPLAGPRPIFAPWIPWLTSLPASAAYETRGPVATMKSRMATKTPCDSGQSRQAAFFSKQCGEVLVARVKAPQPEIQAGLEKDVSAGPALPTHGARCASVSERALWRHASEVGAVCGNAARTHLRGGRRATGVPTATLKLRLFRTPGGQGGQSPDFIVKFRARRRRHAERKLVTVPSVQQPDLAPACRPARRDLRQIGDEDPSVPRNPVPVSRATLCRLAHFLGGEKPIPSLSESRSPALVLLPAVP